MPAHPPEAAEGQNGPSPGEEGARPIRSGPWCSQERGGLGGPSCGGVVAALVAEVAEPSQGPRAPGQGSAATVDAPRASGLLAALPHLVQRGRAQESQLITD